MNALGGKRPILYCTWRKNPEERRVSDGSTQTDPDQRETRRCLQHSVDSKVTGTISTYFRGARRGLEELSVSIYFRTGNWGGLAVTLMCKELRGILHTSFYLNDSSLCIPHIRLYGFGSSDSSWHKARWYNRLIGVTFASGDFQSEKILLRSFDSS